MVEWCTEPGLVLDFLEDHPQIWHIYFTPEIDAPTFESVRKLTEGGAHQHFVGELGKPV